MPLSDAIKAAIAGQETAEVILPMVSLTHPTWASPMYLVNNNEPIIHNGNSYIPFAFSVTLPDDEEEGLPVLSFSAQNVGRELIQQLRGLTGKVSASVFWVLASSPEYVEIGPYDVELYGVDYDALTITGSLGLDPVLDQPFGNLIMSPSTTPGLF